MAKCENINARTQRNIEKINAKAQRRKDARTQRNIEKINAKTPGRKGAKKKWEKINAKAQRRKEIYKLIGAAGSELLETV
jgi:hypothetical protein